MAWEEYKPPISIERTDIPSPTGGIKPTIAIAMPHIATWSAEFVEAMWNPLKSLPLPWCHKIYFLCRVPSLPTARNTLVQEFLKTKADYILWLDSDMMPEEPTDPNVALQMLYNALQETGEHIAAGLYRAKQVHGFNYAAWQETAKPDGSPTFTPLMEWPSNINWFSVDVTGLGFCLMKRKVFEDMAAAGYGKPGKQFFHWEDPNSMSEDFYMFSKARKEFGYKAWIFTRVRLSHMGGLVVKTDEMVKCPHCEKEFSLVGAGVRVPRI